MLWQADEVRSRRPRVVDEIRNGHWFFEQSLIDAAERLLADYRRRLPDAPTPIRFGTWIGGDADGNPNAGPETIAEALERARRLLARALPGRGARARRGARRLVAADAGERRAAGVDRRGRARAAGVRGRARRPEPRRAVPAQAVADVAAARRRPLREPRGLRRGSRACSTGACARIAARASPTASSPRSAAASSCSVSTSRSSTCACMRTSSPPEATARVRRSQQSPTRARGTARPRSTR